MVGVGYHLSAVGCQLDISMIADGISIQDHFDAYLTPEFHSRFSGRYTWSECRDDLLSMMDNDTEVLSDFLECVYGWTEDDIPKTTAQCATYRRKIKQDIFTGIRKLTASERGRLAYSHLRFRLITARLAREGGHRQRKEWERNVPHWQFIIELITGGRFILTMPRNHRRDVIGFWAMRRSEPWDGWLCLEWKTSASGRQYMNMRKYDEKYA